MEQINRNKLPLRYYLNIHMIKNDIPNEMDLLYELATNDSTSTGKEVTLSHIKHSLSFKIGNEELENLLNSLIKQNYITNVEHKKSNTYKIIKHPWI